MKRIETYLRHVHWSRGACRRAFAWLCALAMLFGTNAIDLRVFAEVLPELTQMPEAVYACGLVEHQHGPECYDGDVLICPLPEHLHTPECLIDEDEDEKEIVIAGNEEPEQTDRYLFMPI